VLFHHLYQKFIACSAGKFLDPHEVYTQWSITPVPAALAVLRVHWLKLEQEPPMFLALLAFPSALSFGLNKQLFAAVDLEWPGKPEVLPADAW
jgi:hypothetical protein